MRGNRSGSGSLLLAAVAAAVALGLVLKVVPDLDLFGTETRDRSQPAVLRSIEKLSEYRAATANLQVIIDVEQDAKLLPSFIKGEKVLFVAAGTVDAGVDFSRLERGRVRVSEDRREATIRLPYPRLSDARVDPGRSRVFDRERGVLDRVGDLFEDNPTEDRPLYVLAERKLMEAARADPALLETAQRNTRSMLEGLLGGLGFTRVTVRFDAPPL